MEKRPEKNNIAQSKTACNTNNNYPLFFRSKYFRGRRIHGQYDILVEQAEFKDISVQANSLTGVTASIITQQKGNTKAYR